MYQHGGDIYSNKNMIDYSANINPFGMPEAVKQAAKEAVDASICYPDVQCRVLKEAIAKKEGVSAEHIFCGNGAADVIFALVHARMPKHALLPVPSFYEYQQALNSVHCKNVFYQMEEKDGFGLRRDLLDLITPNIDMVFLCNPNNPTGILTEVSLLEEILHKCERTDTLLVLDECFIDFLPDPERHSMMSWAERSDALFLLKAFTKMYAMPGLRLGYGICCCGALIDQMERVSQPWRVSVPAQAAGTAACEEVQFVEESRREIQKQKQIMVTSMQKMGYQIYGSEANYIFFEGEHHLCDQMKAKGFLIRDCSNYQGLHAGFYRIAVRRESDNQAFLKALEEVHKII